MEGYIKLYRRILKWEWYDDINTKTLFLHCLLKAKHEAKKWHGIEINPGQFITSISNLSKELNLSVQQIRTSLDKLISTNEITKRQHSSCSIITIKNWTQFQINNKPNNKQATSEQQQLKNEKNDKNYNLVIKEEEVEEDRENQNFDFSKNWYGEYQNVHLDDEQFGKLKSLILNDKFLNEIIEALSENIAAKRKNAPLYDEQRPWMHYVILKKYWRYRKLNPNKFTSDKSVKLSAMEDEDEMDKMLEKIRERQKK